MHRILDLLLLQDGRKVGFGLWLAIVSSIFLCLKLITSLEWLNCMYLSSALIGGGTVLDTYLKGKDNATSSSS